MIFATDIPYEGGADTVSGYRATLDFFTLDPIQTVSTLGSFILAMLLYPNIQKKAQDDADDSDIEIVAVKEAPKRQLRSSTRSRRAMNLAWLESDGEESDDGGDGGDDDDFDEDNDGA